MWIIVNYYSKNKNFLPFYASKSPKISSNIIYYQLLSNYKEFDIYWKYSSCKQLVVNRMNLNFYQIASENFTLILQLIRLGAWKKIAIFAWRNFHQPLAKNYCHTFVHWSQEDQTSEIRSRCWTPACLQAKSNNIRVGLFLNYDTQFWRFSDHLCPSMCIFFH